jgi:TetR/AcrR family transcriptional repressor of nem operon
MSAGRPLSFNPDDAVQAAMHVFWMQGYEGTSLQDLLQATALSKSSLYQAFGSKQALFVRCFNHYCHSHSARMRACLARALSGRAFIEDTFHAVAAGAGGGLEGRGCLLMNTATEFGLRDATVGGLIADGMARFAEVFREAIVRAQAEGDIPRERDPRALADYLVSSMSGLRTMVKAGMPSARASAIVQGVLRGLG